MLVERLEKHYVKYSAFAIKVFFSLFLKNENENNCVKIIIHSNITNLIVNCNISSNRQN